jgi:excisionase family DNA binding protein
VAGPALFRANEVAEALRVTRGSVYRKIEAGELGAVRLGSGPKAPLRIPSLEIARFLFPDKEVERV